MLDCPFRHSWRSLHHPVLWSQRRGFLEAQPLFISAPPCCRNIVVASVLGSPFGPFRVGVYSAHSGSVLRFHPLGAGATTYNTPQVAGFSSFILGVAHS